MKVYIYIYIYAFSRCFYPKRLTLHFKLQFYILSALAFPGNRTHDLGVASAMLYHLSYRKACVRLIYIKLFLFFYKCMQTIKWRQTAENNGGPCKGKVTLKGYSCASKNDAKGVPWSSKSDTKGSWPSINMWRVRSENVLVLEVLPLDTDIVWSHSILK